MKKIIEDLEKEKEVLKERINTINVVLEGMRKLCKHVDENGVSTFVSDGHDSHKEYYKCSICGYETYV